MATYKNITIKMKGGKTRKQRAMVLASGKLKFVKNLTTSRVKSTKKSKKNNPKRRNRKMPRRRRGRGRRGSRKFTIPIAPIAGILAAPAVSAAIKAGLNQDWDGVLYECKKFVGFSNDKFDAFALMSNVGPIVAGLLIHKFVGGAPLNLNRQLAAAGVPIIRI